MRICGVDEAGRGPIAGPVSAAAVILPPDFPISILKDSKKLSESQREKAFVEIQRYAMWSQAWAWPHEIDEINILQASLLAMKRAIYTLPVVPDYVLIDGNKIPNLSIPARAIVKGDTIEPTIMAASIVAKVCRDRLMLRYDWLYPEYGYAKHKGYPTKQHCRACIDCGPSPIQRTTFTIPNYKY